MTLDLMLTGCVARDVHSQTGVILKNIEQGYSVYMVGGIPPGVFGEAYAICTATDLPNAVFRCEWFLLTQRPTESLHSGVVDISSTGVPKELGEIDLGFAMNEALAQARFDIFSLLEKRAQQVNREEIAYLPFELKRTPTPLLGCWMRGLYTNELRQMKLQTASYQLRTYLGLLEQVRSIRRPG